MNKPIKINPHIINDISRLEKHFAEWINYYNVVWDKISETDSEHIHDIKERIHYLEKEIKNNGNKNTI